MRILAIETSCDDTCVAILETKGNKNPRFKILSNIISSQVKLHAKYGGVWPSLAKREHQKNLPVVLKKAQKEAKDIKIDSIAVTVGPGLEPCLWVGVNFAKDLAKKLKVPIIPVNHVEAHIFANLINNRKLTINNFPAVCLVVSGGHTQLILMKDFGKYKVLGETRDDAAGECFDKVARILELGYPGGPAIASEAAKYKTRDTKNKTQLPRPMIYQKNYDFSFSGLKTAVLYLAKRLTEDGKKLTIDQKREIAAESQQAIIDVLLHKTLKAAKDCKAKSIILGGGVVSNKELRKQFVKRIKKEIPYSKLYIPDSKLCTDNAAMVAVAGYFSAPRSSQVIEAEANLRLK